MDKINKFSGEYFFLSNFYPCEIVDEDNFKYHSSEQYYMLQKATNHEDKAKILNTKNAAEAKKIGRQIKLREDWEEVKYKVMYDALRLKFTQNKDSKQKLLDTGDAYLVEGNTWGDKIWGQVNGKGEDWLGRLLMYVRKELRG